MKVLIGLKVLICTLIVASVSVHTSDRRMGVPEFVECDRNKVTSYHGVIESLAQKSGHLTLVIHTDYDTTEAISLAVNSELQLLNQIRFNGESVEKVNWENLKGLKAAAWICEEKDMLPIIDFKKSGNN